MASFYQEKSLEYSLKGLEILRNETIQLFQNRNNYLSFGTGAIAILFYSAATSQYSYPFLTYVILLLFVPLFSCFLIIVSVNINGRIVELSRYLKSREMLITYMLESTREGRIFGGSTTEVPRKILKEISNEEVNQLTDGDILAEQIPIYWERYCLNPDAQKLTNIDVHNYLTIWVFSIISIISYGVALVFKSSLKKCPSPDKCVDEFKFFQQKDLILDFPSDLLLLIILSFLIFTCVFFLIRVCNYIEKAENQESGWSFFVISLIIILLYIGGSIICFITFRYFLKVQDFPFLSLLIFFISLVALNRFGETLLLGVFKAENEAVKDELTNTSTIVKDWYFLCLNLAEFLVMIIFLRFHPEASIFVLILSTFSYTILVQIPSFRQLAHKPLKDDIFKGYTRGQ